MLSITSLLFEGYPRNFWHIRAEEEEEEEEERRRRRRRIYSY